MADNTRMHSSPSLNTNTPVSAIAVGRLIVGTVGSGFPLATTACQIRIAAIRNKAVIKAIWNNAE